MATLPLTRILNALLALGWFFAYQHGLPEYPGALVRTLAGPFARQTQCDEAREYVAAYLKWVELPNAKVQDRCVERQDA